MTSRLSLLAFSPIALGAAGQAMAAKPLTQKKYAELRLKQVMTHWAKQKVPGLRIGAAS